MCKKRVRYLTSSFHNFTNLAISIQCLIHNLNSTGFTFNIYCRNYTLHCLERKKLPKHFYNSAFSYLFLHNILFHAFHHYKHATEITNFINRLPNLLFVGITDNEAVLVSINWYTCTEFNGRCRSNLCLGSVNRSRP
jgi:hypothetical protein